MRIKRRKRGKMLGNGRRHGASIELERKESQRVAVVGFLVKRIYRALHFGIAV